MGTKCLTGKKRQATRDSLILMREEGHAELVFRGLVFDIVPDQFDIKDGYAFVNTKRGIKLGYLSSKEGIRVLPLTVRDGEICHTRADSFFISDKQILALITGWKPLPR